MEIQFQTCHVLILALCSCVFHFWSGCQGQMISPLSGQGVGPGSGDDIGLFYLNSTNPVAAAGLQFPKVYVSVYLDRLLKVNEQDYGFEAILFVRLSWDDPRAAGEIYRRTNETYAAGKGDDCKRQCHTQYHQCCDTVWLPGLDLVNVWGLPQDRVDFEVISLNVLNLTNVDWIRCFNGIFYTPMNFRRFPFDCQVLVIEFWGQACCHELRTSSVSTTLGTLDTDRPKAADLSSWEVTNITLEAFQFNLDRLVAAGTPSHPEEPWALKPGRQQQSLEPNFVPQGEIHDSVRVYISVRRLSLFYVISYICPIILCVMLSWWTFWVSPRNIETRLGVLVSLFLSLTALQFVVSSQLPASSYITVMGWVVVTSYILIVVATAETILVYSIFRWYVHARDKRCESCETSREASRETEAANGSMNAATNDLGTVLWPSDPVEVKDDSVDMPAGQEGGSLREGESLREGSTATLSGSSRRESRREPLQVRFRRTLTVQGRSLVRLMSSNPLRSTLEMTRQLDSTLRRDLAKANKIISKIEAFSMCAFPLLYGILLSIVFSA